MDLICLPITAFQCIIEHMVADAGLYKAVRLRLVCSKSLEVNPMSSCLVKGSSSSKPETFDAEATRAIFRTPIFNFDKSLRTEYMTPECVSLRLKGLVIKPTLSPWQSPLIAAVSHLTTLLLNADPTLEKTDEQRLKISFALCEALAHTVSPQTLAQVLRRTDQTVFERSEGISLIDRPECILAGAAAAGNLKLVQTLLSQSADPDLKSQHFGYALQHAARTGDNDMVLSLLAHTYKVGEVETSPLVLALKAACVGGHEQVVKRILECPLKYRPIPYPAYMDAITVASRHGHAHLVLLLLERGSFPNKHYVMTKSLFDASSRGYTNVVQMLLDLGLDVNSVSRERLTALHHAARGGHTRTVEMLLRRGAKCHGYGLEGPLYLAATNGHEDVARVLPDHGADIKAQGRDGCILAWAAKNGESSMIRFLVERGTDLLAPDCGPIALELAAHYGHEENVMLLSSLCEYVNGRADRESPILSALECGQDRVVRKLLEIGAKQIDPLATDHVDTFQANEILISDRSA